MARCEACGKSTTAQSRLCRQHYLERRRYQEAVERDQQDRQLLGLLANARPSVVARQLGWTPQHVYAAWQAAKRRQRLLRTLRDSSEQEHLGLLS